MGRHWTEINQEEWRDTMACHDTTTPQGRAFLILIGTALAVQAAGTYHAHSLVIGGTFYLSWFLLRLGVPLIVVVILGIPLSRLGLGAPKIDRSTGVILAAGAVALIVAFAGIYFLQGYFDYYASSFRGPAPLARLYRFMLFTGSTLPGWEFLHRSFLLMGILHVLKERDGIPDATAARIAVGVVWIFEVVFHFIKPGVEALGMLAGSPLLSWLALRTGSIWLPFLAHLFVEGLFIAALIFR